MCDYLPLSLKEESLWSSAGRYKGCFHTVQDCITSIWALAKNILEKVGPPKHITGVVLWGGSVSKLCTPWKEPYSTRTEVVYPGLQEPSAGGRVVEHQC